MPVAQRRRLAAVAAVADIAWYLLDLAILVLGGTAIHATAFRRAAGFIIRAGLDVLGLRYRWAVAVMTIVRVVGVVGLVVRVSEGQQASQLVALPLLVLATVAGARSLHE